MGSALGVAKTAAAKIGCTVEDWLARRANGERWCTSCRAWWFIENMAADRNRPGGVGATCRACAADGFQALREARRVVSSRG